MNKRISVMILVLIVVGLACGTPSLDRPDTVETLTMPDSREDAQISEPTDIPAPILPTEIEGLVKAGTHLVGTDIQSGIYVGVAGDGLFSSCYWERLSGLTGDFDEILANENAEGLFYLEILTTDVALTIKCELLPISQVPARSEFLTVIPIGTYIIGRDIQPGLYKGEAGDDILDSCYWERLSGVSGSFDEIIANENAQGQYFIQVLPDDFALHVSCEVELIE